MREGIESGKIRPRETRTESRQSFGVRSMPVRCRRCSPFVFTTDYSPGDCATMLQSGGVQLLDVQDAHGGSQLRIRYPLGIEPHGVVPEIK